MKGHDDLEVYEFCSAYTAALVGRLSDKTLSDNPIWRDSGPGGIRTLDSRIRNPVPYPC